MTMIDRAYNPNVFGFNCLELSCWSVAPSLMVEVLKRLMPHYAGVVSGLMELLFSFLRAAQSTVYLPLYADVVSGSSSTL